MKISSIEMRATRRFSHLKIEDIPTKAKLVFLCGPNGSGKSSLFDGIRSFFLSNASGRPDPAYMMKRMTDEAAAKVFPVSTVPTGAGPPMTMMMPRQSSTQIIFHSRVSLSPISPPALGIAAPAIMQPPISASSFYFRAAHRNEAEFASTNISREAGLATDGAGPRSIDTDSAVSRNYRRMVSNSVEAVWGDGADKQTFGDYRQSTIGLVSTALERLFPGLVFTGIGSPLDGGTFKFTKGVSKDFPYRDLSGGEKAAFDLILDVLVRQNTLSDAIMCIDEPEAHLNARVHGDLIEILFDNTADDSQLWVASHSIGMMRSARDLYLQCPDQVAFLDFEDHDFDEVCTLKPVRPDRALWKRALNVALGDIAGLVSPERVVICEGEETERSLDATSYSNIFRHSHPETLFVPGGGSKDVATDGRGYSYLLSMVAPSIKVVKLVDRDDKAGDEIINNDTLRTLSRRNIESFLFSDAVLERFCEAREAGSWARIAPRIKQALEASVSRGHPPDDRKPAASQIYQALRSELRIYGEAGSHLALARNLLTDYVIQGTTEYAELEATIFGPAV